MASKHSAREKIHEENLGRPGFPKKEAEIVPHRQDENRVARKSVTRGGGGGCFEELGSQQKVEGEQDKIEKLSDWILL